MHTVVITIARVIVIVNQFWAYFQTNHSVYNKMYLINGYFYAIPFKMERYHRLNLSTKYNVRHLRHTALLWDTHLK